MISDPDRLARLTDSAPPPTDRLRRICAWCPDFDPRSPRNAQATHMICPACFARMHKALDQVGAP